MVEIVIADTAPRHPVIVTSHVAGFQGQDLLSPKIGPPDWSDWYSICNWGECRMMEIGIGRMAFPTIGNPYAAVA